MRSVARTYDIPSNQLFHWRKLYREGLLGNQAEQATQSKLVAVRLVDEQQRSTRQQQTDVDQALHLSAATAAGLGTIQLETEKGRLCIVAQRIQRYCTSCWSDGWDDCAANRDTDLDCGRVDRSPTGLHRTKRDRATQAGTGSICRPCFCVPRSARRSDQSALVGCVTNASESLQSCTEDGRRPPGVGFQESASNHPELLRSKGVVVNVRGKGIGKDVR